MAKKEKISIFDSARAKVSSVSKSSKDDKEVVYIDGLESKLLELEFLKAQVKDLTAQEKAINDEVKEISREKFVELYKANKENPNTFLIKDGEGCVMVIPTDSYKKIEDRDRANQLIEEYGEDVITIEENYYFNPKVLERNMAAVEKLIMDAKTISDDDKRNLLLPDIKYSITKGYIDKLSQYGSKMQTVIDDIQPTIALKNCGGKMEEGGMMGDDFIGNVYDNDTDDDADKNDDIIYMEFIVKNAETQKEFEILLNKLFDKYFIDYGDNIEKDGYDLDYLFNLNIFQDSSNGEFTEYTTSFGVPDDDDIIIDIMDSIVEKFGDSVVFKGDTQYAKGGKVDGRSTRAKSTWNRGGAWTRDRNAHNKSEDWEKPMNKRKYAEGGGVSEKSYKDQSKNTKKNLGSTFNYDTWSDYTNDFGNVSVFSIADETNSKFLGDLLEGDYGRLYSEGKIIDLNSMDESEQSSIENSSTGYISDTYLSDEKYKDEVSKYFIKINIKDRSRYAEGGGVERFDEISEYVKKVRENRKAKGLGVMTQKEHSDFISELQGKFNVSEKFVENIKDWYINNYPTDELGQEINEITFRDLWNSNSDNIYDVIGVGDSIIRERLFEHLSEIYGVSYDYVYNRLFRNEYKRGGKVGGVDTLTKNGRKVFNEMKRKKQDRYYIDAKRVGWFAKEMKITLDEEEMKDVADLYVSTSGIGTKGTHYADGGMMAKGGVPRNVGRDWIFKSKQKWEQDYDRKREYKEYKKEGWLANWFKDGGGVGSIISEIKMKYPSLKVESYNNGADISVRGKNKNAIYKLQEQYGGDVMEDYETDDLVLEFSVNSIPAKFGEVYNEVVNVIMTKQNISYDEAVDIINNEEMEAWLRNMVEYHGETDANFLAEQILTTDEGKYAKGGVPRNVGRDWIFKSKQKWEQDYDRKREWKEYKKEGWFANWFKDGGEAEATYKGNDVYPPFVDNFDYGSDLTDESMVKNNLVDGEISSIILKQIVGCELSYPYQIVGAIKLQKCFMRPYYKLS